MLSLKITQLVVSLSLLCLLLLGFSYSVEGAARLITDVAEAANQQCDFQYYCLDEQHDGPRCNKSCRQKGYREGICSFTSSNREDKIDVNYYGFIAHCCCIR
ncbi:hypothetical protein MKX03_029410 [Papaver bracteatum]|nr:hypothetical protein MKX03_029410 [Papaver bracteatum]